MNIFLIIIGVILLVICGTMFLSTNVAIKNQYNWNDFYKSIEEKNLPVPEEIVYKLVCKMNFWFGIGLVIGLLLAISGIILQITLK